MPSRSISNLPPVVRFLFMTIQGFESDFYARVGGELERLDHTVSHVTVSRRAARRLRERGRDVACLLETLDDLAEPADLNAEVARIERAYDLPTIREAYRTDPASDGLSEVRAIRRTVRYFRAFERLLEELSPDVLVPEVGNELPRVVSHLVALERGIPTFLLFYTIFPNPLRLYVDEMHAPIVPPNELRALDDGERHEVRTFVREFTARAEPIRAHRRAPINGRRLRQLREYAVARMTDDRDNEYLHPLRWTYENVQEWARRQAARALYDDVPARPFVYFPLHVTEDYKIKRLIPHCADQAAIVEQIADALPPGYDLVLKEHPMSIGRNGLGLLRRVRRRSNVVLVDPHTSSHDLIGGAAAVAVISSTVGLEALLYGKPVLTLGQPFYSGYGITLDIGSFAELRQKVPALLAFSPDREQTERFLHAAMRRCYPGKPVLVDRSDENARTLAASLDRATRELVPDRVPALSA
jgi:hypothetical protein